jgi:hypothetical protein
MVGLILWWAGLDLAAGEMLSRGLLELLARAQLEGLVGRRMARSPFVGLGAWRDHSHAVNVGREPSSRTYHWGYTA